MRLSVEVGLREAAADDVDFLTDVVLAAHGPRESTTPGWDPAAFRAGVREDAADQVAGGVVNGTTYVIEAATRRVGRLRLVRHEGAIEVAGIQISPQMQGRGIGTAVLKRVQREAALTSRPVWLEVDDDNSAAARLYERLGFAPGGTARLPGRRRLLWTASA